MRQQLKLHLVLREYLPKIVAYKKKDNPFRAACCLYCLGALAFICCFQAGKKLFL